ncbi:MAG TPA: AAA family ATPase, partial [Candidatus Woesebacteria bacterium]|nr:AAA family ATPase [Candidatus Woesebacteria bacterium]
MIIESLEIKNYRSIKDAKLECDNLTAILGRNGTGKSSFLYSLDLFYDVSANVKDEDYYNRDLSAPIEIRVTYTELSSEELSEFNPYIKDNRLIVTKRISSEGGRFSQRYFGAAQQIPEFAEIRKITQKGEKRTAWNELIDRNELSGLTEKVRNSDQIEPLMLAYEAAHPELLITIEKEEQFFGAKSVGGGKLDKYTRFVLVPAVRDANDEVAGKKGAVYQLIDMIVLRQVSARQDIREFRTEFEEKVKKLYSSENLTELPKLGESISELLHKFAPGSALRLKWDEIKAPEILLPTALATLIEDGFEGEISRKGHGLQRALILTLLQQLALTEPAKTEVEETEIVAKPSITPNLILAIEEPELYLHPSRSRYLSNLFLELSDPANTVNRNQILYATHSPYFVDLNRFNQIRCVRKVKSDKSKAKYSVVSLFSIKEASIQLARIYDIDVTTVTPESFKARALPIMNVIVNEGFFADKVLVVEGLSDVGLFWKLQEILKSKWEEKGIVVIPANGKNNIDRPVIIFRGMSIPTYFIFDGDA